MSSNKSAKFPLVFGILAALSLTLSGLLLSVRSGKTAVGIMRMDITMPDTTATTETEPPFGQETTAVDTMPTTTEPPMTTEAPFEQQTMITAAEADNPDPTEMESSAEPAAGQTTAAAETVAAVSSEVSDSPDFTTIFEYPEMSAESSVYEGAPPESSAAEMRYSNYIVRSSVFENEFFDRAVLITALFSALVFSTLFLFLFPGKKPTVGPDGAVLMFSVSLLLLIYTAYGQEILFFGGKLSADVLRDFGGALLSFTLRLIYQFLLFSLILFSLREIISALRAEDRRKWSVTERIFEAAKDRSTPERRLTAAALFMALFAVLVLFFALLPIFYERMRAVFLAGILISVTMFFTMLSSFLLRLSEMKTQREEAVESAVKNERLRVDLIANVSHDLRTPLTSIMGYGNLLEKEEHLSEDGREDLRLLNQKAGYMKDLVDSLFELTKVSSGVIVSEKTQLDLIRLLEQTIGLFEDDLSAASLTVRRHYCADSLMIETDGNFLNRVVANLLQNAVKYALPGTRLHLYVTEEGGKVTIRLTNVAAYEMNFDPAEITERFTRGDESRTTKGSGLGLAIAKTYTEAVGGAFHVEIDGDVFAGVIVLPE